MNLFNDLMLIIQEYMDADSLVYDQKLIINNPKKIFLQYLEYRNRLISKIPRTVHYSKELLSSSELPMFKEAVDNLESLSKNGSNLAPYQSRRLYNLEFNDWLMNDWNIQHLHLGEHQLGERFCTSSESLLYAYFTTSDVYFIAILDHKAFTELELVEILDNNWPVIIDQHTATGIVDVQYHFNSENIHQLRKGGVTGILKLNSGKVLMPLGGGYSTARTSSKAFNEAASYSRLIGYGEEFIAKNEHHVFKTLSTSNTDSIHLVHLDIEKMILRSDDSNLKMMVQFNSPD